MYSNNKGQPPLMPLQPTPPPLQQPPLQQQQQQQQQPPEQPSRKRTKKDRACDLCRRKKIRCDYDQAYPQQPCTSCKSYNKVCAFKEAAKKRGPPKGYVEGLESRLKRMEQLLMNIASNGNLPPETMKAALEEAGAGNSAASVGSSQSEHENESQYSNSVTGQENKSRSVSEVPEEDPDRVKHPNEIQCLECLPDKDTTERPKDEPFSYIGSSSGIYLLSRLFPKDNATIRPDAKEALPRPLEGHEDDLMVARFGTDKLNKLGFARHTNPDDWKLPPKELTDYLIDMYFKRMNRLLPIVDQEQFYEEYNKNSYNAQTFVPIILTICKITCRLLKKEDPMVQKYQVDRTALFLDIHKQLEMNFDLDFLEPKIETIQVLLLNASNAEKWGLESADWIQTSIAVKMAQDLGLHRANTQHSGIPKKEMEAKKRLWWSAYVIDRWIGSSLGRPLTVSDADCDVEYPDPTDSLNEQFIYLVKLSCILGDILRALCSPRARLMSEMGGMGLETMSRSLEQMVIEWKRSLPPHLNLTEDELARISRKEIDVDLKTKINNGAGKLRFAYCAVFLLSKRPFISMGSGQGSTVKMPPECQEALRISIDIFEVIDITELFCGWSLSSYCLAQTHMLTLLNYRNMDADLIKESKCLSDRFKNRHKDFEEYIAEPSIVPFLDLLSKVIAGGNGNSDTNNDNESPNSGVSIPACVQIPTSSDGTNVQGQQQQQNLDSSRMENVQQFLWGASGGIEWQEMVKLLAETGYQI